MKYVIILGDGMSDEPIEEIKGMTPLAYAKTPCMDGIAEKSEIGLASTIPDGMKPGSDTANLAVLGYNPQIYYTGRSPLEALSIGVAMEETDIAIRCNIVTVSEEELFFEEKHILDHSAGEITTAEATELVEVLQKELNNDFYQFYLGTSYRHLMIWKNGVVEDMTAPHDILGKVIGNYLPTNTECKEMMKKSYDILNNHPINIKRAAKGLNKANSIWFWGAGTKPALDSFEDKFGKKGAMISAVDLLKGIAVGARMKNIAVEGADGTLHTNYEGKADAAVKVLLEDGYDFVYVHIEAPDEMGHQGSLTNKIQAIEYLDSRLIAPIYEKMNQSGESYRMLIMPDHPTPIAYRTHTSNPVPYMLYDSTLDLSKVWHYNEAEAKESGNFVAEGYKLISKLFNPTKDVNK